MSDVMLARIEELRAELERAALKYAMTGDLRDLDVISSELLRLHVAAADDYCEPSFPRRLPLPREHSTA